MYCNQCNVGICLDCYIPQEKDEDKQHIHEYLLISENNIPAFFCKLWGEEKKMGINAIIAKWNYAITVIIIY